MQLDSHSMIILIMSLTVIFAISWTGLRLFNGNTTSSIPIDIRSEICQLASCSPLHLRVKKYLVVRRMVKIEYDDDPPYVSSLVF